MLNEVLLEGTVEHTPVWCGLGSGIEFYLIVGDNKFDVIAKDELAESASKWIKKGATLRITGTLCGDECNAWIWAKHIEIQKGDLK